MRSSANSAWGNEYDLIVVGAGHAGCEAALAGARLGLSTIMFAISVDSIAMMPCNPNVGGTSKGHLVRELDALGGEMGKNIDKTFIQSRMLNTSKGPAVHSLRAQADKQKYSMEMRKTLENTPNLTIRQGEVAGVLAEGGNVYGVETASGAIYRGKAVVLATGTYLGARCIFGDVVNPTGPNGLQAATHLTDSLKCLGFAMQRFKTGTPPRVDARTVDFDELEEQRGDEPITPFSFSTDPNTVQKEQSLCWLAYTNEKTHEVIRRNIHRSPLFSGFIEGTGARYCPSIEDKVVKFPQKERHQIFVEPEGLYTNEMYLSGMSSSLPEDVQVEMLRTMKGFSHAHIVRNAYAIEYDCLDATQLLPTLETKSIGGLFCCGQFNGSSGYEEAAAQGLVAGINASRKIIGKEPMVLDRSQAYIGVLIDDLVTKDNREPYRMMTSRAEYRLLLRQDNADLRLTKIGHDMGLIDDARYRRLLEKESAIDAESKRMEETYVGETPQVQELLMSYGSSPLKTGASLAELIRRPELDYWKVGPLDTGREPMHVSPAHQVVVAAMDPVMRREIEEQVNIQIKYAGYIERQRQQVEHFQKLEKRVLPPELDYTQVRGLRLEAMQKLNQRKPTSVGQASRISGVSPADISVLLVYLEAATRRREIQK
ncbi:MAG: tRNA uridine-5-carboxymethylaminomethyl(34) synthesis enzyme MnmG [Lachnospiraceae bacterium]|jgi:tRNA uridine 5-carboxymethylaminomethyl modification enzyme|nr:tRNA uridine-5-carboxymethylaminomethyl(34) synthesis enzyme MnmG [Lachnospiraceae bacterium]